MATVLSTGEDGGRSSSGMVGRDVVRMACDGVLLARSWAAKASQSLETLHKLDMEDHEVGSTRGVALSDCVSLYDDTKYRLQRLFSEPHGYEDGQVWLSGALTNHRTCLDALNDSGSSFVPKAVHNLTNVLSEALSSYALQAHTKDKPQPRLQVDQSNSRLLVSWDASKSRADFVVARDGSSHYQTINQAVAALSKIGGNRPQRVIIYVKAGVYRENVVIERHLKNVMLVGDGIGKTIITSHRNVPGGTTTYSSATFGVSGDGFWARDLTFENTAGPEKHQAVAARVSSDHSIFYRCSFIAYQDTLFVHSLRQFYRDCLIYGTVDFIFGNAAAILQHCEIFVRRPMSHQSNMITAQGREDPNESTGISIHLSSVAPTSDLIAVKGSFRSYLGRPWKRYSRTVFLKTNIDGVIDPKGWEEWRGNFALDTLYYGEYMNLGVGASTSNRVNWPGFHVLNQPSEAYPFTVSRFIQGESWIPMSGVPFIPGV
ncbi:probable pectinesterase/pectinesterase inhibitor 36 [Macadamia integrifolia]|uniref:probable pectinesterase/pectinesterase inhibitor 36 n=1 Tax=Macadamia integrifolia TaxID=60698 RepID=UPI001C4F2FD6|nr:probable pectinesterase/pectinesterase inhibitor 36 [Macadamia integrifolia]